MGCADAPPFACLEDGCPAASITCSLLSESRACGARFTDIWQTLPYEALSGPSIADLCPLSCGRCPSMCLLLSREVMTSPADGTLEVQRLRFALPPGAGHGIGPSSHVKVRAPDAVGQRQRVRAYSMVTDATLTSFNVTVKIYPGGPPHTRGTSSWLGSLPVGSLAHIPEVRSLPWAVPKERASRVGMIAFGVGIVECLEPAELLLDAGAQVRLLYASRTARQILYRKELRSLLARHLGRFHVRHILSRESVTVTSGALAAAEGVEELEEETSGPTAVGGGAWAEGERFSRGRLDATIVTEEFGAWADAEALFVVVGSRQQESSAWQWLAMRRHTQVDAEAASSPRHLLRGSSWRPLVGRETL